MYLVSRVFSLLRCQLAVALAHHDVDAALAGLVLGSAKVATFLFNKLTRGTFQAAFMLASLKAIGCAWH